MANRTNTTSKAMKQLEHNRHIPVLLNEAIKYLDPQEGETVVDATVGGGGHATKICKRIGKRGRLIGIDQDEDALRGLASNLEARPLSGKCEMVLINGNFREMDKLLEKEGIDGADKILFDFGLSSDQLNPPAGGRGFTFLKDEPLLMTFKKDPDENDLTAYKIVNQWSEKEIADIIYKYGEERMSRRIAKKIVEARKKERICSTGQLAEIIEGACPARRGRIHPATKTFQALRIAVNDELNAIEEALEKAWGLLKPDGRIVAISFHSLEDRIVKNFFRNLAKEKKGTVLTKKPITPSVEETKANPRARSAKLRAIEKSAMR